MKFRNFAQLKNISLLASVTLATLNLAVSNKAQATIITGVISNWSETVSREIIGDANNQVSLYWSINTFHKGYFYGSNFPSDSNVAFATNVTDISQITDASQFSFTPDSTGPHCDAVCDPDGVGDFIIWRNINTGYFGVLRIDNIKVFDNDLLTAVLDGTWWFQTDGTGNFSSTPVPEPLTLLGVSTSLLFGAFFKRKLKG